MGIAEAHGLTHRRDGAGSTIRDLVIVHYKGSGISINTPADERGGSKIEGNYIGTNPDVAAGLGNNVGITIVGSSENTIGGSKDAQRNIISGNDKEGVNISSANKNVIINNYIGIAPDNGGDGVLVTGDSALTRIERNVISNNDGNGVEVNGAIVLTPPSGTMIFGNRIGTDIKGMSRLSNLGYGVAIDTATGTHVGRLG